MCLQIDVCSGSLEETEIDEMPVRTILEGRLG
jgi:hypothetical protein